MSIKDNNGQYLLYFHSLLDIFIEMGYTRSSMKRKMAKLKKAIKKWKKSHSHKDWQEIQEISAEIN